MNKILCKRLGVLERRMIPRTMPFAVFTMHPLQPEQTENLQPGERIVSDHYKHSGLLIYAAQRITSDPNDHGQRCEPEGCLEDVVRRIHEDCYFRSRDGSCHSCHGTPVANT